ncbi:hypothetical protein EIP91_010762 [Steccherinum ochraceum]|uniref:Uncharacterized protein n=1 Tax=Steccherinum ochraceum TaxID=92696 RepID=A0A4R0R5I7_9APHY|nr:hypothetical protein EIP91_010762 [Steccherinum ochraceum]
MASNTTSYALNVFATAIANIPAIMDGSAILARDTSAGNILREIGTWSTMVGDDDDLPDLEPLGDDDEDSDSDSDDDATISIFNVLATAFANLPAIMDSSAMFARDTSAGNVLREVDPRSTMVGTAADEDDVPDLEPLGDDDEDGTNHLPLTTFALAAHNSIATVPAGSYPASDVTDSDDADSDDADVSVAVAVSGGDVAQLELFVNRVL